MSPILVPQRSASLWIDETGVRWLLMLVNERRNKGMPAPRPRLTLVAKQPLRPSGSLHDNAIRYPPNLRPGRTLQGRKSLFRRENSPRRSCPDCPRKQARQRGPVLVIGNRGVCACGRWTRTCCETPCQESGADQKLCLSIWTGSYWPVLHSPFAPMPDDRHWVDI